MNAFLILGATVLSVLAVIDWRQTLVIARNPATWYERNPILGEHPSAAAVHVYFALSFALVGVALLLLPLWPALCLTAAGLGLEAVCVVNNYRLGIRPV